MKTPHEIQRQIRELHDEVHALKQQEGYEHISNKTDIELVMAQIYIYTAVGFRFTRVRIAGVQYKFDPASKFLPMIKKF